MTRMALSAAAALAARLPALEYCCPGEAHPIPRGVHLARLAAGFAACADCPHRQAVGTWQPAGVPGKPASIRSPAESISPATGDSGSPAARPRMLDFTAEGIRGVYLNVLTRSVAAQVAAAFSSLIWDRSAPSRLSAHRSAEEVENRANRQQTVRGGPVIVIAADNRPGSPDLLAGVSQGLRRMGCTVLDAGLLTRPEFLFATWHLQAAGGVLVTGAGCDAAWSGLDVVGALGQPWSAGGMLDALQTRICETVVRPARRPGSQRLVSTNTAYAGSLEKYWHALRPLKIAWGCAHSRVQGHCERLFRQLPCRLFPVAIPIRRRETTSAADPDLLRMAATVRKHQADVGLLIEEDGEACAVLDETGVLLSTEDVLDILASRNDAPQVLPQVLCAAPGRGLAVKTGSAAASRNWKTIPGNRESAWNGLIREQAHLAGGSGGRYWFLEERPVCDAIVTIGHLWQALSQSDTPLSQLAKRRVTD